MYWTALYRRQGPLQSYLEQEGFYLLVLGLLSLSLAGSRGLHTWILLTYDPPAERDETLSTSTSRTRDLVKQGVLIDNTLTPLSTLLYYSSSTSISTSFFFPTSNSSLSQVDYFFFWLLVLLFVAATIYLASSIAFVAARYVYHYLFSISFPTKQTRSM